VAEHGVNDGEEEDNPHQVVILEVVEDCESLKDSVALCVICREVHREHNEDADEGNWGEKILLAPKRNAEYFRIIR
jgi:hypothetical protein